MTYRSLGRTGVQVSSACLGTMTFGWDPDDWGSTEEQSREITHHALELGINFFDCADIYARGVSEEILGRALQPTDRHRIVLATKCHGKMDDTDPNSFGNTRKHIREACEASLRRLKTDYIDLYQIHRSQPLVAIDETIRALEDLARAGKIIYAGCSTFAAWQVCEAHYVAKNLGMSGFVSEQPPYNLLDRRIERELLPFCRTHDYAVIPWSPLAGGILSGKYLDPTTAGGRYSESDPNGRATQAPRESLLALQSLAADLGLTSSDLALAWVANQPGITCPIIGARSLEQLTQSVRACEIRLSPETLTKIDTIFAPESHSIDYYRIASQPNARPR